VNLRSLIGSLGIAVAIASGAVAASAQTTTPPSGYRQSSEVNVTLISERLARQIANLQRDAHDYGGHRDAAIGILQNAQNELTAAAQFAAAHGYQMPSTSPITRGGGRRQQSQSDHSVQKAQEVVSRVITRLQKDSRDFGGHRVAAINLLNQAQGELTAGAQYAASHGY
jgi:hypothetical protein